MVTHLPEYIAACDGCRLGLEESDIYQYEEYILCEHCIEDYAGVRVEDISTADDGRSRRPRTPHPSEHYP